MADGTNQALPTETDDFPSDPLDSPGQRAPLGVTKELLKAELDDIKIQKNMRLAVAGFFAIVLLAQNIGLFFIIVWALNSGHLADLQWIFSVLVSGTLFQSYKVAQLIVERLFKPINYKEKQKRFSEHDHDGE